MNDLIIGLLSGAVLASGTFTLRNWRRKSRLRQPWLQLQNKSEQLAQEKRELSQKLDLEIEKGNRLRQELAEQLRQFEAQQQAFQEQQQRLEDEKARCSQLSQELEELEEVWAEAEQNTETEKQEKQAAENKQAKLLEEHKALKHRIAQLKSNLDTADIRLMDQARSLEEAKTRLQTGAIEPERFVQAIAHLLPNITFLRDSTDVMMQEPPPRLNALLSSLRALSDGSLTQNHQNNGVKVIKVHATANRWSEFHVPRANMMRVYFQKSKQSDRYQVLVTEKKNEKTQQKNHAWLKSQPVS